MRLTRVPADRRAYVLRGVGTLRLSGWGARTATAEGRGLSWQISHRGIWQPVFQAADASGDIVGIFRGRTLRPAAGMLTWYDREFDLRTDGLRRERCVLAEDDRILATIETKGAWGSRPVTIGAGKPDALDQGLLLFAVFVVVTLAPHTQPAAMAAA
jgi:hypothetical protein